MKPLFKPDIYLNVLLPLVAGICIYTYLQDASFAIIKNYIPDGLWAYSFASALLIIWNRKLNKLWCLACVLSVAAFELLQLEGMVAGTADVFDLVVYFIFIIAAFGVNPFFKNLFKPFTHEQNQA